MNLSSLYPDLTHTNFPESIDHYEDMTDINLTLKSLVDQYYILYNAGDFAGIVTLLAANPDLDKALFNAEKYNRLKDTLEAQGRYYKDDVQSYLVNIVKNKGDFVETSTYTKYDVVGYVTGGAKQYFMGTVVTIPIGTLPTNTSYYVPLTLRGEQGASGTGLAPKGNWSSVVTYVVDDCVSYNNILWASKATNLNSVPNDINTDWEKILTTPTQFIISATEPVGQATDNFWLKTLDGDGSIEWYRKLVGGTYQRLNSKSKANLIEITDTDGYYTATDVEGALKESHELISTKVSQSDMAGINSNISVQQRDILRIKMRQTGLNLDPNAWSDSIEDITGLNTSLSSGYVFDNTNKSLKYLMSYISMKSVGSAISGGDYSGYPMTNAFDGNLSTFWISSQTGVSINGNAYIGRDFGTSKTIKRVTINTYSETAKNIASAKLQYWNGSVWLDAQILTIPITASTLQTFDIAGNYSGTKWRLLANANPSGVNWNIYEVDFLELTYSQATIIWNAQTSEGTLVKAVVETIQTLGTGTITYYVSRDGGITFTQCTLDTITDISAQSIGTSIVLKVVITGNAELFAVAWGGAV